MTACSVLVFVASLPFDAFYLDSDNPTAWSAPLALLAVGWVAILDGVVAWLANPLLFASWVFVALRRPRPAVISSLLAVACAASFLGCDTIMTSSRPDRASIAGYGTAYWMWLASTVLAAVGSAAGYLGASADTRSAAAAASTRDVAPGS